MNRRIICALLFTGLVKVCVAQMNVPTEFYKNPQLIPQSPDVGTLFKVSDVPMDYTSGSASIKVPLCNISSGKIQIPIIASYATGGIKVQDVASSIGLGWGLDIGGAITIQDDASIQPQYRFANSLIKTEGQAYPVMSNDAAISRFANGYAQKENPVYTFRCGKLSGYFFYDIYGVLQVCTDNEGVKIINTNGNLSIPNSFKIISDDGLEYLFNIAESYSVQGNSVPGTLFLSQITDMNSNRMVFFKYKPKPEYAIHTDSYSQYYTVQKIQRQGTPCPWPENDAFVSTSATQLNTLQIDSIIYDGGYVKFDASNDRLDMDKVRITGIRQYASNGTKVNDIKFNCSYFYNDTYSNGTVNNYRLKLDSIVFWDQTTARNRFGFEYNTTQLLPPYKVNNLPNNYAENSTAVDYWGFYNGKIHNQGTIPREIAIARGFDPNPIYNNNWGDRNVDSNYTSANILKKIIYPTGGYAIFQYENNQVDSSMFGKLVGGIRVKSVAYFDMQNGTKPALVRSFKYLKGTLMNMSDYFPFTYDKVKVSPPCGNDGFMDGTAYYTRTISSEPLGSFAYSNNVPIFYSEVEEYQTNGGNENGKTFYEFNFENPLFAYCRIKEYGNRYLVNRSNWQSGQLVMKIDYKSLNGTYIPVQKTINEYEKYREATPKMGLHVSKSDESGRLYDLVGSGASFHYGWWLAAYGQYYYVYFDAYRYIGAMKLTKTITTNYVGTTDSLVNQTTYYYDNPSYLVPTRIEQVKSRADKDVTVTLYPSDYADTTGFIGSMKRANYLSYPIETVRYRENNSGKTILSGQIAIYDSSAQALRRQVWSLENDWPIEANNFKFSNRGAGQFYPAGVASVFNRDPKYKITAFYDSYDSWGNLTSYHQADNIPTTFIWGYKGLHPVAKIEGVDHNTAIQFVNPSILDNIVGTDTQMRTELNKLRINLPQFLVNTYTYFPTIGLTSETDPAGKSIFYEYDNAVKLRLIKDMNGKILKLFNSQYQQPISH
ncbi:hypothetical protein [Chitinophaga defluvii]|uniref:YD repeat-containing protein n=1 Tax=Chitinophaga defluvii TaxID=3163343 RepID=A0ABV2T1K4_9BACT